MCENGVASRVIMQLFDVVELIVPITGGMPSAGSVDALKMTRVFSVD